MHNRKCDSLAKAFNDAHDDEEGKGDGGSEGGEEGEDGGDEDAAAIQSLSPVFLGQSSSGQLRYHISAKNTMRDHTLNQSNLYPKKNAPRIHPCSLAPHAKGPSGGGPSVELVPTGQLELSTMLPFVAIAVLLTMATIATERLTRMA